MYISACEGLGQLSQAVSALKDDEQTFQSKLSAIQDLLKRKFTDPNDPGLHERRKELRNLFNSVPPFQARKLHDRLKLRRKDDELSRLFHDRLATPTRNEMLGILDNLIRTHERQLTDAAWQALLSVSLRDVDPYLIDALLVPMLDAWEVGLNLACNEFPPQLDEQLFESERDLRKSIYNRLGQALRDRAKFLQRTSNAFRDRVDQERQRREQERQRRRAPRPGPQQVPI